MNMTKKDTQTIDGDALTDVTGGAAWPPAEAAPAQAAKPDLEGGPAKPALPATPTLPDLVGGTAKPKSGC
jgi:hypothetical protein